MDIYMGTHEHIYKEIHTQMHTSIQQKHIHTNM